MGLNGPRAGFACWAWDYDNDGWLDIFAASASRDLTSIVTSMIGRPHYALPGKLYRNASGHAFEDVTVQAGVDGAYGTMGCNFADFDNDGWLDFYLGTGEPSLATLVPNRMFKNVAGSRFADITGSSRTGHLQKGHGVACGDWDRDGDVDLFIEMGGAVNGDKYHNILFQNPGQGNHWLTVKLSGRKTNRAAFGARIKVVTDEPQPRTIYRVVSSGSSFGANPLEQTIGLAGAKTVARLEIDWPASHTTQVFRGVAADQAIAITEFDSSFRRLDHKPFGSPTESERSRTPAGSSYGTGAGSRCARKLALTGDLMTAIRRLLVAASIVAACLVVAWLARPKTAPAAASRGVGQMHPRTQHLDSSGFNAATQIVRPWRSDAALRQIAQEWEGIGRKGVALMDRRLADARASPARRHYAVADEVGISALRRRSRGLVRNTRSTCAPRSKATHARRECGWDR